MLKKLKNISIVVLCALAIDLSSCKRDLVTSPKIADATVSITETATQDTIDYTVSTDTNSIKVINLHATTKSPVSGTHIVSFGIDTTQMAAFRTKYGNNFLTLPSNSYFVAMANSQIVNGSNQSSQAEFNIVNSSQLTAGKTYVLPAIIKTVDDATDAIVKGHGGVIFLVIKTSSINGIPIDKSSWQILSYSSQYDPKTYPATNVLDNNFATSWVTSLAGPMPQNLIINMNQQNTLRCVTYNQPQSASKGGYPSKIEIFTSTDNMTWSDQGTFTGTPSNSTQILKFPTLTKAQYINFTILTVVPYAGYNVAFISEIGANN